MNMNSFTSFRVVNWVSNTYTIVSLLLQGKVELTLEIISDEEAEQKPTGQGREEPNAYPKLEEPK